MPRGRSAILDAEAKTAIREEKNALRVQLREAKAAEKEAERALKVCTREVIRLTKAVEKLDTKLEKDKDARARK